MRRTKLLVASALVLAVQACASSQPGDLQVDLTLHGAIADVTITNPSDQPVRVLAWTLPDSDLQEPLFQLTRDGQPVPYIGPMYKRAQPDASDYVTIAAGATVTRSVNLANFYDMRTTGNYTVELGTSMVAAHIDGRLVLAKPVKPDSCTAAQHTIINAAIIQGQAYAANAAQYLIKTPASGTPRYTTWFGAFTGAGWTKATNDFNAIAGQLNSQVVPDCSCKQKNVYAYVTPTNPYVITLCGAFWTAPATGTDSQAGTLVHEMSHFTTTANTNDWAYGQTACQSLAVSDPTKALDNADSHEYFAENNPALQ